MEQQAVNTNNFCIAEFDVRIIFKGHLNDMGLLPSFEPFRTHNTGGALLFQLTVDDSLEPVGEESKEPIGSFDTGNGDTVVDLLGNGGYQYIINDIKGRPCCLLQTNKDFSDCRCALHGDYNMRRFGLNNALMLVFAFAGSTRQTLLIHASLVRHNGYGYAFTAKSGTGKSTHVSLWLRHIPGCDLMNDDNPIVRLIDGKPYIYGGPWSGKTPCYRPVKAPLGAITRIERAPANSISRLSPIAAFASLLPSCSSMKWDKDIFDAICDNITKIIESGDIMFTLQCLPDKEAAILCHKAISR